MISRCVRSLRQRLEMRQSGGIRRPEGPMDHRITLVPQTCGYCTASVGFCQVRFRTQISNCLPSHVNRVAAVNHQRGKGASKRNRNRGVGVRHSNLACAHQERISCANW